MPDSKGERHTSRHKLQNSVREQGISPPKRVVQEFEIGDSVHIDIDPSYQEGRPSPKFQGLTGEVVDRQGAAYVVEIKDRDKTKKVISEPAHLKKQE